MTVKELNGREARCLPSFRRIRWTWRRWLLLGLAIVPFVDQFLIPISLWDDRRGEGMLFLILTFRAMASAEPPLAVAAACACLVALSAAMGHGVVREVSPVWTPIAFGLLIFIVLTWRKGRKGAPPDAKRHPGP